QMRTALVIMRYPCCQQTLHMVCRQRDNKVQALSAQCAQQSFTEGIRLRSPHRCLEHPQPQMTYALVKLRGENAVPIMQKEAVAMVSRDRCAELVEGPGRRGMRRDIDMQDAMGGLFHHHKDIKHAKGGSVPQLL